MPNNDGRYNRQEVLDSQLPYYVQRSGQWSGNKYPFAVLLSKTRCKELGVPIMEHGEQPSAFLYSPNAGRGTNDTSHRYYALYDRTEAYMVIKEKLIDREIMGTPSDPPLTVD